MDKIPQDLCRRMKITSIPQIYRNINRWREILTVLSKYGLANWISFLGPDFAKDFFKTRQGEAIARYRWEIRLRLAIQELGPTAIKLGQMLSTRPDLVGVRLAEELQHLQTDVPADPPRGGPQADRAGVRPADRRAVRPSSTDEAAGLGVDRPGPRARLKTGEPVVVKVRHADIAAEGGRSTLDILSGLAQLAERFPEFRELPSAGDRRGVPADDPPRAGFPPRAAEHAAVCPRFRRRPDGPHSPAPIRSCQHGRGADDGADRGDQALATRRA